MGLRVSEGLSAGADGRIRCSWTSDKLDYQKYHDEEWGMPISDDNRLFEKICLEGFQSGLSWLTILRKRENFRDAFANFDYEKIAEFGSDDVERLARNKGIVRHRGKIQSTISKKKRGWSFIGPTTAYAFMQAMGLVNDHIEGCEFRDQVEESRRNFIRPS